MRKITVKFITLGCKTNIYESEAMAQKFEEAGYEITEKGPADIYVVNTCTVTETGASKSLKMIRRARRENENACVAVAGCLAQTEAERLRREERPDVLIGNDNKADIVRLCEEALKGKKVDCIRKANELKEYEEFGVIRRQRRIRAEIKIEDGCGNFCSYCKIPYARGPVRSRDILKIEEEAKSIRESGYSEIVLTGIHIGSYGRDLENGMGLIDVIERVAAVAGDMRIRLGSLEPVMINEDFVRRAAPLKGLCHQFHLSLQSGCDKTLKAMNRHYTAAEFKKAVNNLRDAFDDCAITTDLIVGFPGESEEDFKESKSFCEDIGFAQMHIFPYSVREGTAAAKLPDHISGAEKKRRTHIMLELAEKMKKEFCEKYKNGVVSVLFEQEKDGEWSGMTSNYTEVRVVSDADLRGQTANVRIEAYSDKGYLTGKLCRPCADDVR